MLLEFLRWDNGKEFACNAGDARNAGWIPGSGRSCGRGNDNPLQYYCLENSMDREAWQAIVHGVSKSWTGGVVQEGGDKCIHMADPLQSTAETNTTL